MEFIDIIGKVLKIKSVQSVIVLVIAFFLVRIIKGIIKKTLNKNVSNRSETLIRVLGKLVSFTIYFFALLQIFQIQFNIQPASILAATGIFSVALGFGAQSLVKDIISGFFILFENQFAVLELVTIDGFTGTIQEMTLRTTIIKNIYGDLYTIPNGSITKVINHSRCERGVILEVGVSFGDDINNVIKTMEIVAQKAKDELTAITKLPDVLGVTELGNSGVKVKMLINCKIGEQFYIEREMLRRIKYAFDEQGISIPYNQIIINGK